MTHYKFYALIAALVVSLAATAAPKKEKEAAPEPPQKLPWTLREHYTFSGGPLRLDYAKDNAEWRIKFFQEDSESARMNPDLLIRDVAFSIELQDGRVLTHEMFGAAGETIMDRGPSNIEAAGEGTHYAIHFAPLEGLAVEHAITTVKQWNFLLLTVKIVNQGEKPVGIRKITSAIIQPGNIMGLSESAEMGLSNVLFHGGHPVYAGAGKSASFRIFDPVRQVILNMGILPGGMAASALDMRSESGSWHGRAESDFSPVKQLDPGASLDADPLWISMGTPPAQQDTQYSYLLYHHCRNALAPQQPRAWVTVPDTEGLSTLRAEAANAAALGIGHALVPGNWESKPGSLEGGAPRYPRNMAEAASALQGAGVTPGITMDPMLGEGGGDFTAKSQDGQTWINPGVPGGRAAMADRVRALVGKGFGFVVVEPSAVPDDVLVAFKLTRAEAETGAFAAATDAVEGTKAVVLAAAAADLPLERDAWLAAAGAVARIREGDIAIAPVRVRAGKGDKIDPETLTALGLWSGPFEFLGAPAGATGQNFAAILARPPLRARPQDACRTAPLVWMSRAGININKNVAEGLFLFSGASPWDIASLETFSAQDAAPVIWRDSGEAIAPLEGSSLPQATQWTTLGLCTPAGEPIFCGVAGETLLGLNQFKKISWDAASKQFTGQLEGPFKKGARAVFYVPQGMELRSASLDGHSVRPTKNGSWVQLPVEPAGGTFTLEF